MLVTRFGRVSDLIVLRQLVPGSIQTRHVFDAAVFGSDRPALIVPEKLPFDMTDHIMIAWCAPSRYSGLRGTGVRRGGPIGVPVREAVLGPTFDVLGDVRDGGPASATEVPRRPIHRARPIHPAPPLARQQGSRGVFEIGIRSSTSCAR